MDKLLTTTVVVFYLLTFCMCNAINENEPTCYSRYDFEEKLLERTLTAELKLKQMEKFLKSMEAAWKLQETEINRLKAEIAVDKDKMNADVGAVIETANEQVTSMSKDVRDFQKKANASIKKYLEEQAAAGGGAIYTRWGRMTCPENATTIYTGIAVGPHYTHSGGTTTTMCLPSDPIFSNYHPGVQGMTHLYGAEFEGAAQTTSIFGDDFDDDDVLCAVCEAKGRRSQMLVPARNVCYNGWQLEYSGFLMTDHYKHYRTNMKCVDGHPQAAEGESKDSNGDLFYFVEASGQIPNPPYIREQELTCAICTK